MVVDTFARAVSSTVKVTVTAQPSSTGEGIEIIAVAGGAALVVVLVVAIVVMKKRKK
jgi:LPXTG-motif cell wall-anchored protein